MDAQLIGQAVERLDQGTDLVGTPARLGQRGWEGAVGLGAEWQPNRSPIGQSQRRLGDLPGWPGYRRGQQQTSQRSRYDRANREEQRRQVEATQNRLNLVERVGGL